MINKYTLILINAYMKHVTNNAEESIKNALSRLKNGKYETLMDNGSKIKVNIIINKKYKTASLILQALQNKHLITLTLLKR